MQHLYGYMGMGEAQTDEQTAFADDLEGWLHTGPAAALPALAEELAVKLKKPASQIGVLAAMFNDMTTLQGIVQRLRSGIIPPDPPVAERYPTVPLLKANVLANFQKAIALNDQLTYLPPGAPPPVVDDRPALTPRSAAEIAAAAAGPPLNILPLAIAGGLALFVWMGI